MSPMPATPATIMPLHRMSTEAAALSPIRVGFYAVSAGVVEARESSTHRLRLHVGQPVWASCGWGGRLQRGLRCEGDFDLTPAGLAGVWEDESPATFLLMQLSPALIEAAAGDLGLDRRAVALEPEAQLRDPSLEHIAWALKRELEAGQPTGSISTGSASRSPPGWCRATPPGVRRRRAARLCPAASGGASPTISRRISMAICRCAGWQPWQISASRISSCCSGAAPACRYTNTSFVAAWSGRGSCCRKATCRSPKWHWKRASPIRAIWPSCASPAGGGALRPFAARVIRTTSPAEHARRRPILRDRSGAQP
jgi:hypothetical protein